jgi:hypothetical protein
VGLGGGQNKNRLQACTRITHASLPTRTSGGAFQAPPPIYLKKGHGFYSGSLLNCYFKSKLWRLLVSSMQPNICNLQSSVFLMRPAESLEHAQILKIPFPAKKIQN